MLKKILNVIQAKPRLGETMSYEQARTALEAQTDNMHRALAIRDDTPPEMLYYLAEKAKAPVRAVVAANPSTPHKANLILAADSDDEVRCELARKIARLLPDLSADEKTRLRDATIEVLEQLAADHLPKVRRILAEELHSERAVPRAIILKLAHDVDELVCVPILEYSPLLGDEDLLEVIATSTVSGALEAIARRQSVSAPVADAVVASLDIPAVSALLANPNAQIREQTLDMIVERAEAVDAWHAPLVMRADLSLRAVRRIAEFVARGLLDQLVARNDLDQETVRDLRARMRSRIEREDSWSDADDAPDQDEKDAQAAFEAGEIDDAYIEAAVQTGKRNLVTHALALKSGLNAGTVRRIVASRNAKSVTALGWKAGLSMRTAVQLQNQLAHIPPQSTLFALNGIEYPMPKDEMQWHLDYFAPDKA